MRLKMTYFKEEDILHLVYINHKRQRFLRDSVLETTQARLLKLKAA